MGGVLGFVSRGSASSFVGSSCAFPFEFRGPSFENRGMSVRNRGGFPFEIPGAPSENRAVSIRNSGNTGVFYVRL